MASASAHYNGVDGQKRNHFTVTALGRWSSLNKTIPAVDKISTLHVYDFDNTLFKTPLPNPALWTTPTIGMLSRQDAFINSGWWHDNQVLGATGLGLEKEESRAWQGHWNEKIVELVRLTMQQPDALCVLLTGRGEQKFADLLRRIVTSKQLEFDLLCLKPQVGPANQKFSSTMKFKQVLLTELMETYKLATEICVYEDRPAHTKGFRDFFHEYNTMQATQPTRGPIQAVVIQVNDTHTKLDPVSEVAQVQRMINEHNEAMLKHPIHLRPNALRIKKNIFFTSYMIEPADSERLLSLIQIPKKFSGDAARIHGTNIIIVPRPCPEAILTKVGGLGSKMTWQVTGTACYYSGVWAACVTPVPATAVYHSENQVPLVVLALKKGARPADAGKINTWSALPPEKRFTFETTVGEKAILRIETNDPREDEYSSLFGGNKAGDAGAGGGNNNKRKFKGDDWNPPKQPAADAVVVGGGGGGGGGRGGHRHHMNGGSGTGSGNRGGRNGGRGGLVGGRGGRGGGHRGGRGGGGGGGGGGVGVGSGRRGGGFTHYRSLDDVGSKNTPTEVNYDESHPPANAPTGPRSEQS